MQSGKKKIKEKKFKEAIQCFDDVLLLWSEWKPADAEKTKAEKLLAAREASLSDINNDILSFYLMSAQSKLGEHQQEFGLAGTEELIKRVEFGILKAQEITKTAERSRIGGQDEKAASQYMEALSYCADYRPASLALKSIPPAAPRELQVRIVGTEAWLTWKPSVAGAGLSYQIQRRSIGAGQLLGEGITIGETRNCEYHDLDTPSGVPYYYKVISTRGGVSSIEAITSGPHLRMEEPGHVLAEAGDSQILLRWKRPEGCVHVEVWRAEGQSRPIVGKGRRLIATESSAIDHNVRNGKTYSYLIVASFKDPDSRGLIHTKGIEITATPISPPPPINDLSARKFGRKVILDWTSPKSGDVEIRVSRKKVKISEGDTIPITEAIHAGDAIAVSKRGATQYRLEGQGSFYFTPLTMLAGTAVIGKSAVVTTLEEVSALNTIRVGEAIQLTWSWPAGSKVVLLTWRNDRYPENIDERGNQQREVTLAEYRRLEKYIIDKAPYARHYFTIFVKDCETNVCSLGAKVLEARGLEKQVMYRVVARRSLFRRLLRAAWIEIRTRDDVEFLPTIKAVVREEMPAINPSDGYVVATFEDVNLSYGSAKLALPLDRIRGFVKLFFVDSSNSKEIRLIPVGSQEIKRDED